MGGSSLGCVRCVASNATAPPAVIMRGHAFMQNVRRGHYELGIEARPGRRVAAAFTELAEVI